MTKDSHHNGSVFVDYLCNREFLESRQGMKIINEHMLLGWLADQNLPLQKTLAHMAKSEFKRQWHLNQCYLDLLQELAPDFEKLSISPTLLKGSVLLKSIYPELGTRSMSDVDILIDKSELQDVVNLLKEKGFEEHNSIKWKANSHKVELIRKTNKIELVVELHTSLFYHTKEPRWETTGFEISPYKTLSKEHFLLFQCTHLGFQHTFLKLFWVLDIHYWLIQNEDLDHQLIIDLAKKYRVYNSLIFTLFILKKFFSTPLPPIFIRAQSKISPIKKLLFNKEFLIDPKKNMGQYLLIKHLCKDSIVESLAYDIGWIKNKLS